VRAHWATGFIAGPLAGIALLVLPTPGVLLTLVLALLLLKTRGLPALAGMVCGTAAAGLALLARANAICEIAYAGCRGPDFTTAVATVFALLIVGVGLTFAQYVRARARASI
jgi:chromate transport protein ChrA